MQRHCAACYRLEKEIDVLNGLDPILIFSFYKATPTLAAKIPLAQDLGLDRLELPPIPIYLSEQATGIYIDTEDKNIDIETNVETDRTGLDPSVNQKAIGVVTTIKMEARKDSIGLTLLSAVAEQIVNKLTSKEYGITYLHGPTTIFNGLLHSFAVSTESNTDKAKITLEIVKDGVKPAGAVEVNRVTGTASTNDGGVLTAVTTPSGGSAPTTGSIPVGNGALP